MLQALPLACRIVCGNAVHFDVRPHSSGHLDHTTSGGRCVYVEKGPLWVEPLNQWRAKAQVEWVQSLEERQRLVLMVVLRCIVYLSIMKGFTSSIFQL